MVQIPDAVRRQLAPITKYHFWILAGMVPLLLLPALFVANGGQRAAIAGAKSTIEGYASTLGAIRNEPEHPNEAWAETLDRHAAALRKDLFGEWTTFWESQQPLRIWPGELGPDFLAAIGAVEAGSRRELQFRDLQRYQNTVADIVRRLPGRMGCQELMGGRDGGDAAVPGGRRAVADEEAAENPEASRSLPVLDWRSDDQGRLLESFTWEKPPSTAQVLLAQEELWVYGLFCDVIKRMNTGATAHFDSRITHVEELAVGYPAAEENPGGQGTGRVLAAREPGPAGDAGLPPPDAGLAAPGGTPTPPQGRPSHPRFSRFMGTIDAAPGLEASPPGAEPTDPAVGGRVAGFSPDDMFRQWIYVDFNGRPLTAAELATSPDAQFVHLMPFLLRVVVDQRQVDRLLTELAGSSVPIDVRQVRIDAAGQRGAGGELGRGGGLGGGFGLLQGGGQGPLRPFDVVLELRGTVGLATRPNPSLFDATGQDPLGTGTGGS